MTVEQFGLWSALAIIWFSAVVAPGPNFIAILHVAASENRKAALMTAAGVGFGTFIWAAAGVYGLKALFTVLPATALAIKLAGAVYLIWVGIKLWREAGRMALEMEAGAARQMSLLQAFNFGLLTNLANPKTAVFAASLFAVSVPPGAPAWFAILSIATIVGISLSWYTLLATVGSLDVFARLYNRARTTMLRITGAIFVAYGLKLIVDNR